MKHFNFYWCDGNNNPDPEIPGVEVMTKKDVLSAIFWGLYGIDPDTKDEELRNCEREDKITVTQFCETAKVGEELQGGDFNIKRID